MLFLHFVRKYSLLILIILIYFAYNLTTTNGREISSKSFNSIKLLAEELERQLQGRLREITAKVENFKPPVTRAKRGIENPARTENKDLHILQEIKELRHKLPTPSIISSVAYVKTSQDIYLISAAKSHLNGSTERVNSLIWVWDYTDKTFQLLTFVETPGAIGVEAFVIDDEAYFILALNTHHRLLDEKMHWTKLYKIGPKKIESIQTFPTTGVTKWKSFVSHKRSFLMKSSIVQWRKLEKLHEDYSRLIVPKTSSEVELYRWSGKAFVKITSLQASQTTSMDVATVMGRTLIVLVNQTFTEKTIHSTTLVYELSPSTTDSYVQTKLIQRLNEDQATSDVHFITRNNDLYLAIAYEFRVQDKIQYSGVDSLILKFNGLFFVRFQYIHSYCALQWTSLRGSNNELALHLQTDSTQVTILQLIDDSWKNIYVKLPQNFTNFLDRKANMLSFVHEGTNLLVIPSGNTIQFFKLNFVAESPASMGSEFLRECRETWDTTNKFSIKRKNFEQSEQRLASLIQSQKITGVKRFQAVKVRNLQVENMTVTDTNIYRHVIRNRHQFLNEKFLRLPKNLNGYLKKNQTQTITENVKVNKLRVDQLEARNVNFNFVHDVKFCVFLQNAIRFPMPEMHSRKIHFEHLVFNDVLKLHGTLNNVNIPDEVVFTDRTNRFIAPKTFIHGMNIARNLKIKNTLNRIQPQHIMLTRGKQVIRRETHVYGDIAALSIFVDGEVRVGNVPWSQFVQDVVRIDEPIIIKGQKIMTERVDIAALQVEGLVSGVNMNTMFKKAVSLGDIVNLREKVEFNYVVFDKNWFIDGHLNGLKVPMDLVLVSDKEWNVDLEFALPVLHLRGIVVMGRVNGLIVDRNSIMTRSDNQVVTGKKRFADIHVEPHLNIISGYVNSDNLNGIIRKIIENTAFNDYQPEYQHKVHVHNLFVTGRLPINLRRLFYDTVKTHKDFTFDQSAIFIKTTTFKHNVELPTQVFKHLVPVKRAGRLIIHRKLFHNLVFEDNIIVRGLLNGRNFNRFVDNILTITGNQTVKAPKTFFSLEVESDSLILNRINHIRLEDAIKLNEQVVLNEKITFDVAPVVMEDSVIEKTTIKFLNDKPTVFWFSDTMRRDFVQLITAPKNFVSVLNIGEKMTDYKDLYVTGDIYINGGVNLKKFVEDAVFVDETNIIDSVTYITSEVVIEELETRIVDNVDVIDLFTTSLSLDEKRCVEINSHVTIDHLQTGTINGHDLINFFKNVIFTDDVQYPPNLHFYNVTAREINIQEYFVIPLVDYKAIKFGKDVLKINDDNVVITGSKIFENVIAIKKLKLEGTLNDINITLLNNNVLRQGVRQEIGGVLRLDKMHVKNSVTVKGLVSGHDLSKVLPDIWLIDENVTIDHLIEVDEIVHMPDVPEDMKIHGLLDGINLIQIWNSVLTVEGYQVVRLPMTFKNKVIFNNVKIERNVDMIETSFVNNVHLPRWESKIVKIDKPQDITSMQTFVDPVVFKNELVIDGTINHVHLDDILKLDSYNQEIPSNIEFEEVITERIEVIGLIMGIDIQQWEKESYIIEDQKILLFEHKTEFNEVFLEDARFETTIAEIDLSRIVTVTGKQRITGAKFFIEQIEIPRWPPSLFLNGNVNSMEKHFPLVITELRTRPLPYPCEPFYIYYMYGCYLILPARPAFDQCDKISRSRSSFNDVEKKLLLEMKLQETTSGWIIPGVGKITVCYYEARLRVLEELTITGNFTYTNQTYVISGRGPSVYSTTLELKLQQNLINFYRVMGYIKYNKNQISVMKERTCKNLRTIEQTLINAYKPIAEVAVLQTLNHVNKVVPLYLHPRTGEPNFLAIEDHQISLYHWHNKKFSFIHSVSIQQPQKTVELNLRSYSDTTNEKIFLFRGLPGLCPRTAINAIQVLHFSSNIGWPPGIRLNSTFSKPLSTCVPVRNIQTALVRSEVYLIVGHDREIVVTKFLPYDHNYPTIKKMEPYQIYYVKSIDDHGLFAVSSHYNGVSLINIYNLNTIHRRIEHKISIHDLPKIRQISVLTNTWPYYLLFLTNTQIQLIEYFPNTNEFNSKQILNHECPKELFWVSTRDENWLIVSSCSCRAHFYTLTSGYLVKLHDVEAGIFATPYVIEYEQTTLLITQLKRSCFDEAVTTGILKIVRKGPAYRNECQLPC